MTYVRLRVCQPSCPAHPPRPKDVTRRVIRDACGPETRARSERAHILRPETQELDPQNEEQSELLDDEVSQLDGAGSGVDTAVTYPVAS